jgi:hypothetical protein
VISEIPDVIMNSSKGAVFAVIGGALILALLVIGYMVFVLPGLGGPVEPSRPPESFPSTTSIPVPSEISTPIPVPSDTPSASPSPSLASAAVIIVIADWDAQGGLLEVSGYVADHVEEGGRCTLTVTGPTSATSTRDAVPDVSTTSCGTLTISGEMLKSGSYSATLAYESATSGGTSEATEVTVQK